MSVEALWVASFGDASDPQMIPGYSNAGVVVLETGRIYGGDFGYYYLGKYQIDGDKIFADVEIVHFNGPILDAFQLGIPKFAIRMEGIIADPYIIGEMWPVKFPNRRIKVQLEHKAALP